MALRRYVAKIAIWCYLKPVRSLFQFLFVVKEPLLHFGEPNITNIAYTQIQPLTHTQAIESAKFQVVPKSCQTVWPSSIQCLWVGTLNALAMQAYAISLLTHYMLGNFPCFLPSVYFFYFFKIVVL